MTCTTVLQVYADIIYFCFFHRLSQGRACAVPQIHDCDLMLSAKDSSQLVLAASPIRWFGKHGLEYLDYGRLYKLGLLSHPLPMLI